MFKVKNAQYTLKCRMRYGGGIPPAWKQPMTRKDFSFYVRIYSVAIYYKPCLCWLGAQNHRTCPWSSTSERFGDTFPRLHKHIFYYSRSRSHNREASPLSWEGSDHWDWITENYFLLDTKRTSSLNEEDGIELRKIIAPFWCKTPHHNLKYIAILTWARTNK
jgi:hypothetical protein